jgi:glutamine synthetase
LVRVPVFKSGYEKGTRIELRSADPACNPYLAFAVMLAAGVDGIDNDYRLPDPVERNIFEMSSEDRHAMNIQALPDSLENAVRAMAGSDLVKNTLGEHLFATLLANKKVEWDAYRTSVTDYELQKYLPFL